LSRPLSRAPLFPYTTLFRSGALVIVPHKEKAGSLMGSLSEDARLSGAVNVIVRDASRLRGHNTDMDGIRAGMAAILPRAQGRWRSEEHTSELQSPYDLVCRL